MLPWILTHDGPLNTGPKALVGKLNMAGKSQKCEPEEIFHKLKPLVPSWWCNLVGYGSFLDMGPSWQIWGHRGRLEAHSVTLFELKLSASWSVSCNSCPSSQHHVAAYHHTSPRVMMDDSTSYWAEINPSSFKLSLQIFWHHSVGCNQCSSNVIMLHWGLPGREAIAHP